MTLGSKISALRKERGITQEALAQKLDVTNQAVSKWESDQCCPDISLLPKIADIFDITLDALFDRPVKQAEQIIDGLPWPDDNTLRAVAYMGHRLKGSCAPKKGFSIRIEQDVDAVISDFNIQCGNVGGNVEAALSVTCGNVDGNVDAGTDVNCGDVTGNVDAGTDVTCGSVGGSVDAGTDVHCGDVNGNVDAGCDVQCGNVGAGVDAGCDVHCGNVQGDIDAGCGVHIHK